MLFRKIIALLTTLLLLARCKSREERIMEKFDSVNHSLEKASSVIEENNYAKFYYDIELKQKKDPPLASRADTIYRTTEAILGLMDRLRSELQSLDSSGNSTTPATHLLVHTPASDSLQRMLITLAAFDSTLTLPEQFKVNSWSEEYFKNTPTVAAITILNKFESDCRTATRISLSAIDHRL